MTRAERTIVLHWRGLATLCAIVALFGISWALWHQMDADRAASDRRYAAAAAEADKRGLAVSTLATDVRQLRAQVQAGGETPVAPDPSRAVEDLPDRAEVPVPIPGPRGADGSPGPSGSPGATGRAGSPGAAGASGSPGIPGAAGATGPVGPAGPVGPQGVPGVQGEPGATGPQGERGERGDTGERGPSGASCEDGFSWQTPSWDPDARVCRRDGAPDPSDSPSASPAAALDPRRLQYM